MSETSFASERPTAGLLCHRAAAPCSSNVSSRPAGPTTLPYSIRLVNFHSGASWRLREGAPLRHRPAPEVCTKPRSGMAMIRDAAATACDCSAACETRIGPWTRIWTWTSLGRGTRKLTAATTALPGESVNLCHLQPGSADSESNYHMIWIWPRAALKRIRWQSGGTCTTRNRCAQKKLCCRLRAESAASHLWLYPHHWGSSWVVNLADCIVDLSSAHVLVSV